MIGFLFGAHQLLISFLTSANNVKCHVKDLDLDGINILRFHLMGRSELKDPFQDRL